VQPQQSFLDSLGTTGNRVPPERPFRGTVQEGRFKFMRIIWYKNSFLPVIFVQIHPGTFGGTIVRIRMRLNFVATAFMLVWFGMGSWPLFRASADRLLLGMQTFGVLLVLSGFVPEARKAGRLIREALSEA
jgi:hypothetical protein